MSKIKIVVSTLLFPEIHYVCGKQPLRGQNFQEFDTNYHKKSRI